MAIEAIQQTFTSKFKDMWLSTSHLYIGRDKTRAKKLSRSQVHVLSIHRPYNVVLTWHNPTEDTYTPPVYMVV